MSFLSSPQSLQLPARRVETEAMETTSPNNARRVILFILKRYPVPTGMQMRGQWLSPQRPVQEIDPNENKDESQDPGPVFLCDRLADLAGLRGRFGVKNGQAEREKGGKKCQGQKGSEGGKECGLIGSGVEGVTGGGGQANGFHMDDRQEEAQAGADGEGGERPARAGLLAHGEKFHQLGPQGFTLGVGMGSLRLAVKLLPKGVDAQTHKGAAENHPEPPGDPGGMRGGGGVGQEVTGAEEEGDPGGRAEKVSEGVRPGMATVGGEQEADDENLRADKDTETKRGTDGQGVKHKSAWPRGWRASTSADPSPADVLPLGQ